MNKQRETLGPGLDEAVPATLASSSSSSLLLLLPFITMEQASFFYVPHFQEYWRKYIYSPGVQGRSQANAR